MKNTISNYEKQAIRLADLREVKLDVEKIHSTKKVYEH